MGLLTVGGEEKIRSILLRQPADLIDLLFDLQTFQVVELRLVALKGAVNIVLASPMRLVLTLQQNKSERQDKKVKRDDANQKNKNIQYTTV